MRLGMRTIVAALCAMPAVSSAVPVTIEFDGIVTYKLDQLGIDGGIALGDAFSGSFTYDDETAPYALGSELSVYLQVVSAFNVNFSGVSFNRAALPAGPGNTEDSSASINNNRSEDGADGFFFGSSFQPLAMDPADPLFFRAGFVSGVSSNQDTFADLSLPHSLEFASFDQFPPMFSMQYTLYKTLDEVGGLGLGGRGQIDGRLTSLHTATSVPEPAPLVLFATGLGLILLQRRRFSARA